MSDRYLWDGSGPPDPDVQRLERLLSEFRSHRPAPDLPAAGLRRRLALHWSAIAAGVVLSAAGTWLASRGAPAGWQVSRAGAAPSRWSAGQTFETAADAHATVTVGNIGFIEVEPHSRLRLERARANQQRMALDLGIIHAFISAPPGSFVVDTPSAVATDLGCFYTLAVDQDGSALVSVLAGWAGFQHAGRESFIPAGAACRSRPGQGLGTPYREQASPAFRQALQDFDFDHGGDPALAVVLAQAAKDDAFTLWHLLTRCQPAQVGQALPPANPPSACQARVYDALAALVPPPAGVTREGILRGDRHMLDLWWDRLGLGYSGWFRHFALTR